MTFAEVLAQVRELLQSKGRVSYRALKVQFTLDDDYLEGLKDELIEAERVAADEGGKVLVWVGGTAVVSDQLPVASPQPPTPSTQHLNLRLTAGERRQLTVMFCDLVGSTALSEELDPEELREVVRAYQQTSAAVIERYAGHIAQYLGDGLLVYFGYPTAHEDDTQRAVRAGLSILAAMQDTEGSNPRLPSEQHDVLEGAAERQVRVGRSFKAGLQVRIGIHTGLVVVGEMGSGDKREQLALGETPNIAARLQGLAEPDTVVLSAAAQRLVAGLFECQDLGPQMLKGISIPLSVYRVVRESEAHSRFEVAVGVGLTLLVGREHEVGLLQERWERAKRGEGQVVLLSGEAGIGKSRLMQELKEQVIAEGAIRIEFRCSPYHQNSAFYPIIDHLQRLLQFAPHDTPQAKLAKLTQLLAHYRFPQADTLPLLAALLSLPHPEGAPPITLSPQKQKQKTQEALVAWIVEEAEKAAVYCAWEDLHWADPSTLELLTLYLDQIPTSRVFTVLTFRPDFTPPWRPRSHITQLTLNRLGRSQVEAMVEQVTGGKMLPSEVLRQIVAKTDGVPLFVEELTKMVLESGLLTAVNDHYELSGPLPPLAIPSTMQASLLARLDRLSTVRDEEVLQQSLKQLVEAELVYQRGLTPQATYLFKHALIQDTAYQSLLKSTRQQYHQQIAQVLEEQFPETKETQPELLAHHYTEAGLIAQALPYWQRAGQRAAQRSANVEAISHLTKGLELLKILPDTSERMQQELTLQTTLGPVLMAAKGYAAPEVEQSYARARALCQQIGETPQLCPVLNGLWSFYVVRSEHRTAYELAEQLLKLAESQQDPACLVEAHWTLGASLFCLGDVASAQAHVEQSIALYDPQEHRSLAFLYGHDPGMSSLCFAALALWHLGYPDQALKRSQAAVTLAREVSHPYSLVYALDFAAWCHRLRRERQASKEQAEAGIVLSTEHGVPVFLAMGTIFRGWALAEQSREAEGGAQIRQGLVAWQATGAECFYPHFLALLAEAYGKVGQAEEGLSTLSEALTLVNRTGERFYEAELYRLKGQLTVQKFQVSGSTFQVQNSPASGVR
ncbi:MAG: AAA family ATPase, partial [Deltaproteobacteria bacterium]|nr:AAA family ATPase [Deltaproteobacteria bacterium]